jgi:hypothetical protein
VDVAAARNERDEAGDVSAFDMGGEAIVQLLETVGAEWRARGHGAPRSGAG